MNRVAFRNFVLAMLHPQQRRKLASPPTGTLLTGLDMLARAQYLEGLLGFQFNTVSRLAGSGPSAAKKVINNLLHRYDPTINLTGPAASWSDDRGSKGLYIAAWKGANAIFQKTQTSPVGRPIEADDLLSVNMVSALESSGPPKISVLTYMKLINEATSEEEKEEIFRRALESAQQVAVTDAANESGNFFWSAGKQKSGNQKFVNAVISGEISIASLGKQVAFFASKAAVSAIRKLATESKALAEALKMEMAPGVEEEGDFDISSLNEEGLGPVIQYIVDNPNEPFSAEALEWMLDDISGSSMSPFAKAVMSAYIERIIDNRPLLTDAEFAESFNEEVARGLRERPKGSTKPLQGPTIAVLRGQYLKEVSARLYREMPGFLREALDQMYMRNVMRGRIRGASSRTLRASLIRLAHQNPALRPHLLPLLARRV